MLALRLAEKKAKAVKDQKVRSFYLKFRTCAEKDRLEQILKSIDKNIDKVLFPRQRKPKFCFVVCKKASDVDNVMKAVQKFNHDEVTNLFTKRKTDVKGKDKIQLKSKDYLKNPTTDTKGLLESKDKKSKKKTSDNSSRSIDPLTLIIRNVNPEKINIKEVRRLVPTCGRVKSENSDLEGLVNYVLSFSSLGDALKAFESLHSMTLKDVKLQVQYKRI